MPGRGRPAARHPGRPGVHSVSALEWPSVTRTGENRGRTPGEEELRLQYPPRDRLPSVTPGPFRSIREFASERDVGKRLPKTPGLVSAARPRLRTDSRCARSPSGDLARPAPASDSGSRRSGARRRSSGLPMTQVEVVAGTRPRMRRTPRDCRGQWPAFDPVPLEFHRTKIASGR